MVRPRTGKMGSLHPRKLRIIEVHIESALLHERSMIALFEDLSGLHDYNIVGIVDGRKPVSYNETGPSFHQLRKCFLYLQFGTGIDT